MAVTHSVGLYDPAETSAEVKAAAGFVAGYSGRTRGGVHARPRSVLRAVRKRTTSYCSR